MNEFKSHLAYLRDPRLAAHVTSAHPAWLWSADATHILWANPTAAAIFDAPSSAAIVGYVIDPKGTAALQIARLAASLPHGASPRLERLRGLGGRIGGALLCACSRVTLTDRTTGILMVATEPAGPDLTLADRASRLLAGSDDAIALFGSDGALLHATPAAQVRLGPATTIKAIHAHDLATMALAAGSATGDAGGSPVAIDRIGADSATMLLMSFEHQAAAVVEAKPEPSEPAVETPSPPTPTEPVAAAPTGEAAAPPSARPAAPPERRHGQHPLRFVWQMDADGRFTLGSDDFAEVIGPTTAAALGKPWSEIGATLGLDPEGLIPRAFASRDTWSGITLAFPVDGSNERISVELSGLPVFDRDRSFRGYRGFGVCRDVARLTALMQERRRDAAPPSEPAAPEQPVREERPGLSIVPPSPNVVPFRSSTPPEKPPTLTPVERKAFGELASRLTARLRNAENEASSGEPIADEPLPFADTPPAPETAPPSPPAPPPSSVAVASETGRQPAPETSERAPPGDQRPILDRLPVGVLVYRLDNLLYANRAFLDWTGYDRIEALAAAGGLDALFVEPGVDTLGQNGAKALAITSQNGSTLPVEARLFSTMWDGESSLVLMLAQPSAPKIPANTADAAALQRAEAEARELRSILDTAADGVIMVDRESRVLSANASAAALFGYQVEEMAGFSFTGLFAPESQHAALQGLANAAGRNDAHDLTGRGRDGHSIALSMTASRVGDSKLCAVFRDVTPWKQVADDLSMARQQAEDTSSAKSDFLAKISHEIRTPLNAIIGFSEVMMEERFGPVTNERYKQYLKDIHGSGEHLISLLNDLLDLSKIEAGKLELTFASVEINELTQQCVALMQPQANRERVIIRTSLSQALPAVVADARSVRQIVLNLLSNSIKFTGAGGQVIVSTALNDLGEVVLRVRDTGVGMSEKDIAIALEPFRQLATSVRFGSSGTGLGLPLTKALVEANRATFSIRSALNAGTLVEVAFPGARMAAE